MNSDCYDVVIGKLLMRNRIAGIDMVRSIDSATSTKVAQLEGQPELSELPAIDRIKKN